MNNEIEHKLLVRGYEAYTTNRFFRLISNTWFYVAIDNNLSNFAEIGGFGMFSDDFIRWLEGLIEHPNRLETNFADGKIKIMYDFINGEFMVQPNLISMDQAEKYIDAMNSPHWNTIYLSVNDMKLLINEWTWILSLKISQELPI